MTEDLMWVIRKRNEENMGEMDSIPLNVRIYGDCGTPIWRCPGDSQIFENKYYSSLTNVVNTINLGSKSLDSLTLMLFSGLRFTITSTSVQLLSVWRIKSQLGSLTSVLFHACSLCCFIAVSFLWGHWRLHVPPHCLYFQSLKTLYCYFSNWSKRPKNPVQFTYALALLSSLCFLVYPSADSQCIWTAGCHRSTQPMGRTAPNVWIQWVLNTPLHNILLVPCQCPFLKPIAYPILFHTFPTLATC